MRLDIVIDTDTDTIAVWGDNEIVGYYTEYSNVDFNSTTFQKIIEDAEKEIKK